MAQAPVKVLVGVDALDRCRGALALANQLQTLGRASVTPIHIVELAPEVFPDWVSTSTRTWSGEVAAAAVKEFAPALPNPDLLEALPPEAGLEHAALRLDVDAIIVGRKAQSQDRTLIRLGAVARRLLRTLPRPVVVVPPDYRPPDASSRPVVLATDLSDDSLGAAALAKKFAHALGTNVLVVHTAETLPPLPPQIEFDVRSKMLKERSDGARNALDTWCLEAGLPDVGRHIVAGDPIEGIRRVVDDYAPQLVVCGSRKLGDVQRLFVTSVGSALAASLPVPVAVSP